MPDEPAAATESAVPPAVPVELVVDAANVVGSLPDGWWRDRAGAATRLLAALAVLPGRVVEAPAGTEGAALRVRLARVHAVLEGLARSAEAPGRADGGLVVVRAERDGDTAIADLAHHLAQRQLVPLVVTADRGLRRRLPGVALVAGPGWMRALLEGPGAQ